MLETNCLCKWFLAVNGSCIYVYIYYTYRERERERERWAEFARVAVPEFGPRAAFAARQNAALLRAAEERLGSLLAELHSAMPNLSACGFKASIEKRYPALVKQSTSFGSHFRVVTQHQASDATSVAVAAVAPAMGVDMLALHELVATTRDALTQVSR